uniref:Aminoglycoside phosphotransferase domain-containing protein n=1 Tax=Alexandrium catenella TaxID=2925 RepID=A0A7S1RSE4_ALECA|mmetsp:Transcript_71339/g.189705  ORF Transcript_71339/g.189705 Transcript_71339/m.189705 type:complete len:268 (+) Transcript_71339:2-805(+)
MLTAWAHSGRLGAQLPELFPANKAGFLVGFPVAAKAFDEFWPRVEDFVLRHAPQLFPADVANPGYLAQLRAECMEVGPALGKVNKFCTAGDELWQFLHPNLHIDNAFFFRDASGLQDCGLLDWGGAGTGFLLSQFVSGGGALSLAGAEMRVAHTDALVACYFETLAEFGGPRLDARDMQLRVALMDMAYVIGSMRLTETGRPGDVYEYLPKEAYAGVRGLDDPAFAADSIEALMLRSVVMMLVEGIKTWKGRGYHRLFSDWRAAHVK